MKNLPDRIWVAHFPAEGTFVYTHPQQACDEDQHKLVEYVKANTDTKLFFGIDWGSEDKSVIMTAKKEDGNLNIISIEELEPIRQL